MYIATRILLINSILFEPSRMQLTANTCHFAKSRHSLHCSLNVKNEYILGHCVRFSRSCCRTPRRNRVHGNYSMHAPLRLSIARNPSIERETENVPCTVIVLQAMHAAALKIVPEIFCFRRQALHIIVYSETVFVFEGGFKGGERGQKEEKFPCCYRRCKSLEPCYAQKSIRSFRLASPFQSESKK